ncbi:senescence-associated protein-domain-containing protein [Trametes elegans]|nr:senescence-associated protein-domain-containing protein [Trametes elegans]
MVVHLKHIQLDRLPAELLVEILQHLDLKDVLRCRLVCRSILYTVKESLRLQYSIELAADGLVDGVGCPLTVAERYKLLLERRKRWRFLDWTHVTPISAPALCQAYELVDGVFASSEDNGLNGSRHLSLTWLPTFCEPARYIVRQNMGFALRDFAIDPSQDLIALVVANDPNHLVGLNLAIHLRTMSTNKPHPQARVPELNAPIPFQIGSSFIQIVDDIVGVYFWVHGPGLLIWNWRTGKTVVKSVGFTLSTGAYDFAFLSNRAYMITVTTGPGSIEIYTFDGDGDVSLSTGAHSPSLGGNPLPTKVAVLELPPTKPGQGPTRFQTHSAPFVARPTPGRAFETSPDSRLHVMELSYGDHGRRCNLFVRNRFLLSHVPADLNSGVVSAPLTKRWEEWGPDNTRFMEMIGRFQWLRYVHAERVILPSTSMLAEARVPTMVMLDFNVHPARTDDPVPRDQTELDGRRRCDVITFARPVVMETTFTVPVESRLPFQLSLVTGVLPAMNYSGFMIDHEHLVGMRIPRISTHSVCLESDSYYRHGMSNTLITIPGVTAHHVLGESQVTLGAGELNILAVEGEKDVSLAVGGAAFALRKGVEFGTLEDDPRVYVFSPEIEGVHGGYVKLTLPEGVLEDGSRLSELQTKFEEVLIEHGFLQPAEESRLYTICLSQTTKSLVSIPGVIAAQVVGDETSVLSEGTLSLDVIRQQSVEGQKAGPLLTLTVGTAAFPLYKTTTFGTLAENSRTYLFTPESSADLAELQNQFELVLVEYGLLKDGFEAAADEVSRSVREDSARTAQRIREAKDFYLKTHPRTVDPTQYPKAAHTVTDGSVSGTQSVANAAHWVSGAVTSAASSAGAWIASTFVPTQPGATEQLNAAARGVSDVAQGVTEGTKEIKDTLKDAAGTVVENDYGEETREVVGDVGQSVGNVGAVAGDVATLTSGASLAVAGLQGAAGRQNEEQREVSRERA